MGLIRTLIKNPLVIVFSMNRLNDSFSDAICFTIGKRKTNLPCDFNRNHHRRCFRSHLGMRLVSVTSGKFVVKRGLYIERVRKRTRENKEGGEFEQKGKHIVVPV